MVTFDFRTFPMTIFTILYERKNDSPVAKGRQNSPNVSDLVKNSSLVRTVRLNIGNPFVASSSRLHKT